MLPRIPSLDYAYRPGFSYEKWLEDRSHADVVVKAIEIDMIERSEQMGGVLQSLQAMSDVQQGGFQSICDSLDEINDTLVWGFVEISEGLVAVEEATREVKASVDQVNFAVRQLTQVVLAGFSELTKSISEVAASLDRIEDAVSDVHKAWAYANYRRAVRALEAGYVDDAVKLLESTISGDLSHAPYDLDPRFYFILGNCYAGAFPQEDARQINMEQACLQYGKAIKYVRMDEDVSVSFEAACFAGSAWSNYCLGRFENAIEHYSKAIRLETSFEREFGLLKSMLAAGSLGHARGVLRYCLLRHRNRFLIKAASDPDFIRHKTLIQEERAALIERIKEITRSQYEGHARSLAPFSQMFRDSQKVIEKAGIGTILKTVELDFECLIQGEAVHDLSFLDEGASELGIHNIAGAMSVAQSRVFAARDAEVARLRGAATERMVDARADIRRKYMALIDQFEAQIRKRDATSKRYFVPIKRLFAADEEREISRLQQSMASDLAAFDKERIPLSHDKHKRKFDALNASLERMKAAIQRSNAGEKIQQKVDEVCREIFLNEILNLELR